MKIRPIAKSLGAEVINAQLVNMNEKTFSSVEKAFSRYLVLCFRDQRLKPSDLTNLAKKFGGVGDTPYLAGAQRISRCRPDTEGGEREVTPYLRIRLAH